jgi:hypothetical protein
MGSQNVWKPVRVQFIASEKMEKVGREEREREREREGGRGLNGVIHICI